ncbi:MAG: ACT domain-containing protein, partial [Proteobacteria bacterium]|nr:ACT domain-containing protein [Pseudomonadota bacterium]
AVETAYYLRMQAEDRPGVLAEVTRILGDMGISIEAIIQKEPLPGSDKANIIMLTHKVQEQNMNQAIAAIEALTSIDGAVTRIRMETLGAD